MNLFRIFANVKEHRNMGHVKILGAIVGDIIGETLSDFLGINEEYKQDS